MRQDMAFFDSHQSGEMVNRLTSDVQEFKVCGLQKGAARHATVVALG